MGVECGKIDISKLSEDELISNDNSLWLKADVEEKIYIWRNEPNVVIKFSDSCLTTLCDDQVNVLPSLLMISTALEATKDNVDNDDNGSGEIPKDKTKKKSQTVCGGAVVEELKKASARLDAHSINIKGYQPEAIMPVAAVIPMKSNVKLYGPYASSNFGNSSGGTNVSMDNDLCPWVFGSISLMNSAGQSIVESSAIGLVRSETGSVTIPRLPDLRSLGATVGGAGPNLSDINVTFGSSGITTAYNFRTYTPKFGGLNRHFLDKFKTISKNRREQIKFLRSNQINQNKINSKIEKFKRANKKNDAVKSPAKQYSLTRVIMGEMYDWQTIEDNKFSQRTVVGMDTLSKSVVEMIYDYDKKAYMSLDGLFGPVSKKGDGNLPRYASFDVSCNKASPENPSPPFTIDGDSQSQINDLNQYNLEITQKYLDPLTNKFGSNEHHHSGEGRGHVIDMVGRENTLPDSGIVTSFYKPDDNNRYSSDYRFLGMRGPIVLHSWGYDLDGKPIPNEADIEASTKAGVFKNTNLKDKFLKDWLSKPASWPVAPIDFRFDRKRGVWVTPPGYKVVVIELTESLEPYSTAQAKLINKDTGKNQTFGPKLFDNNGEEVKATEEEDSEAVVKVVERLGQKYSSGTRAYSYYDTFSCEYIILEAKQKQNIRFRLIDLCENTPVEPDYGDSWTKYAGYGDKFPNNHILGIRINCEGDPIDNKGDAVTHEDILDEEKQSDIFINLFDTCGQFGAAYAYFDTNGGLAGFNKWKEKAATGFALSCDPKPENTCYLGESSTQCKTINDLKYESYDIVFLDGYARFVECELKQKLYTTKEKASEEYPDDDYKIDNPEGNAEAEILEIYGDPGNGAAPSFHKNNGGGLKEISFRVFDPFQGYPKDKNPFSNLDYGDKVLAVFNENLKKYVIYNALKTNEKVIKFALIDNKDIGDRISRAVLVDLEGYPIDAAGERLTKENFADNFITVFDSFAIHGYTEPTPKYHNFGTTGFGPALGSEDFDEHMNGITLNGGDEKPPSLPGDETTSVWKGGPFIGFAIQRKMGEDITSGLRDFGEDNEIFFLEHFAHIVEGKIASTDRRINNIYYLGMFRSNSFIDGRVPFTRSGIEEDGRCNLRVRYPLDQHYAGKYITGGFIDKYGENSANEGYGGIDGCKFIAKLDHVNSKVNNGGEKLVYTILEVENIANRVKTVLTKKEKSDELNNGEVKEKKNESEGILSQYMDGFFWDKEKSETRYELTTIYNRYDWTGKALILQWKDEKDLHIHSSLAGYDEMTGAVSYQVEYAGTIAQVAEATVPESLAGRFGLPNGVANPNNKIISKFTNPLFYHGLNPLDASAQLQEEDQPIIDVSNHWMTYADAGIISLWNENSSHKIESSKYRVIYAREAPVIITGIAKEQFKPHKSENIVIETSSDIYASCPGVKSTPIPDLLGKVKNPMGYGAEAGDLVTLQRVNINTIKDNANYYYIVIGTGQLVGNNGTGP